MITFEMFDKLREVETEYRRGMETMYHRTGDASLKETLRQRIVESRARVLAFAEMIEGGIAGIEGYRKDLQEMIKGGYV